MADNEKKEEKNKQGNFFDSKNNINISQKLIKNSFVDKKTNENKTFVLFPNQDPNDERKWENFAIKTDWIIAQHIPGRQEDKERAIINIPPGYTVVLSRPVYSETELDDKGQPVVDHRDYRSMSGYEIKDALNPPHPVKHDPDREMVTITCRKSNTRPVKNHPDLTRIAIPPYSEADEGKPWRTFIVSTDEVHDSMYNTREQIEQGKEDVYFKLPKDGHTKVRRSYPLGTKEHPQGFDDVDKIVQNTDLKDMVEGWKNQERETGIDMEVTGEFDKLPLLDDDMPFDIPEVPEQASVGTSSDDPSL